MTPRTRRTTISRPRLKGDSIAFRLPVHLDDVLKAVAGRANKTPRDYVDELVQAHLNDLEHQRPAATQTVETAGKGAALAAEFFK